VTILDAIILGLVEGITEYLPVSSTGHLILAAWLLGLQDDPARKVAVDSFNIIIQGGAILAVLGLYFKRVAQMIRGVLGQDAEGLRLAIAIVVGFLPAAVIGVLANDWIESKLFGMWPVVTAWLVGGVLIIATAWWAKRGPGRSGGMELAELTWKMALVIGLLQCVAMWPGTSRSLMTIVGGILFGLSPRRAAEFSFLLGLPTLGGACVYKLFKSARHDPAGYLETLGGPLPVAVGILVAAGSAAIAVKWLVGYLSRGGFAAFGWWRVAVAAALGAAILSGRMTL